MNEKPRQCRFCGKWFPLDCFEKAKHYKDGRNYRCEECSKSNNKAKRDKTATKWKTLDPWKEHKTGLKTCNQCNIEKSIKEFSKSIYNSDGMQSECKPCQVTRFQMRTYGIAIEPGDTCEICGSTKRLGIDHCHETNQVRGKLCHDCNLGLGGFKDKESLMLLAIEYIKKKNLFPMAGKRHDSKRKKKRGRKAIDWNAVHKQETGNETTYRSKFQAICKSCGMILMGKPYESGSMAWHPETGEPCQGSASDRIRP
jgi:hypothetical protein